MNYGEELEVGAEMKRRAPAVARNSAPIAEVLEQELPGEGVVLEIASGTGEHAVFMARRFPHLTWQPSDPSTEALASIAAWREDAELENVAAPLTIDASRPPWPVERADAVLCVNMVHISPWAASEGLFRGAGALLHPDAPLVLYGPYFEDEVVPAGSNLAFDADLRRRDPQWGLRRREDIDRLAAANGFALAARYEMPANNLTLVYRRR